MMIAFTFFSTISDMMSMGTGNTMVELFSAEMLFRVCRYRSCNKVFYTSVSTVHLSSDLQRRRTVEDDLGRVFERPATNNSSASRVT